jgi:hypothetical protein
MAFYDRQGVLKQFLTCLRSGQFGIGLWAAGSSSTVVRKPSNVHCRPSTVKIAFFVQQNGVVEDGKLNFSA